MLIKSRRGWELPESALTPEHLFWTRRRVLRSAGAGAALLTSAAALAALSACDGEDEVVEGAGVEVASDDPSASLYPVPRNERYVLDRPITDEAVTTGYNNYMEFGSTKRIRKAAQGLKIRPWTIEIAGLVEREQTLDIDDLLRRMPLEERTYRHRCVEAWSIAVPYSGFSMQALLDLARPLGAAKFVAMQTFDDSSVASGQRQSWYPWPYTEALTIEEAANELAFLATGCYGKPISKQNGAPLRLAVPWKYGFKHVKGINRITFMEHRPKTFWEDVVPDEYGFWANINPDVPHPRWSQATERFYGPDGQEKRPTSLYNGYAEFVASLYANMTGEALFM